MKLWLKLSFVVCLIAVPVSSQENLTDELFRAIQSENAAALRALLAKGLSPNAKDARGNTPLHAAAEHWAIECLEVLLEKGAEVNAQNREGKTPFMVAANIPRALEMLLDAGADPNIRDKQGRTALMNAAEAGELSKVKMLFQRGVDVASKSPEGKTALDIAVETKHERTAALIRGEISSDINCPAMETQMSAVTARLTGVKGQELEVNFEAVFTAAAGNADATLSGELTLSIPENQRQLISKWAGKSSSVIPGRIEIQNAVAGLKKNPNCPELELEFSDVSISEGAILPETRGSLPHFSTKLITDESELSQLLCVWARQSATGRSRGGVLAALNRALNCEEVDHQR